MYIVVELLTYADGTVGNLVWAFDTRNAAEAKYHSVLAAAALSSVPIHACVLLDNRGSRFAGECYRHDIEAVESGE